MPKKASFGNDGLTKEHDEVFLECLKTPLISSLKSAFHQRQLSVFQKQPVIRRTERLKNIRDLLKIADQYLY